MAKNPTEKSMVWKVYTRTNDNDDWEWSCSVPPLILDTFEMNGETSPGGQWYGQFEPVDLSEGQVALIVLRNKTIGLHSYYALVKDDRPQPREPLAVTFNCIRK